MKIEQIFPEVIGDIASLEDRFVAAAIAAGGIETAARQIFGQLPPHLARSGCFLDKLTDLWRYEFGAPITLGTKQVVGTHMWIPVDRLWLAVRTASARLTAAELPPYLARLGDAGRHEDVLFEMRPVTFLSMAVPVAFERFGYGPGTTTVDWVINPGGNREVVIDVKMRLKDLMEQFHQPSESQTVPEPKHNPALLFRSVATKLNVADPEQRLQGAWICTRIAQPEAPLLGAFAALDPTKVHFAILGDWKDDALLLVQREKDREFLMTYFDLKPSTRFSFAEPRNTTSDAEP